MHHFNRKSSIPEAWICGVVRGSYQKGYLDTFCQLKCWSGTFIGHWVIGIYLGLACLPVGRRWD